MVPVFALPLAIDSCPVGRSGNVVSWENGENR